ncbi:MAG: BatD family protein [Chloroherpetonaceae bacterium]|nr:BatD family protein [Chloroherpetonaceae bacterium]
MQMLQRLLLLSLIVTVMYGWQTVCAQDISVRASVSETTVSVGEPFEYQIEIQGSASVESVQLGKLSGVEKYGESQFTSVSIINGRISQSRVLSYTLIARQEGKLIIPPATLRIDGKTYQTNPVEVTVRKSLAQAPHSQSGESHLYSDLVFIKPIVSKTKLYVGEATTVTYKLYERADVTNVVVEKDVKPEGFWVEEIDLQQGRMGVPHTTEFLNGSLYRVYTVKKMILFPTRPGILSNGSYKLSCDALLSRIKPQSGRSLFDDFDAFLGTLGKKVKIDVVAPEIKFEVLPLPEPKPATFTGAVGKYTMTATVDKTKVKAGQPLTFRFTISGEGNLRAVSAPLLTLPESFEKYEPKIEEEISRQSGVVSGTKTIEIVAIPRTSGRFEIEPAAFSFFDVEKREYRTLFSPRFEIDVEGDAAATAAMPMTDKQSLEKLSSDIRFIKTDAVLERHPKPIYQSIWFYSCLLAPLLALLLVWRQRKHEEKLQADVAFARLSRASSEAKKQLRRARELLRQHRPKEFFAELEHALVKFIGNKFNTDDLALTREELRVLLQEKKVPAPVIEDCLKILEKSEYYRYAPANETTDDLSAVYSKAEQVISELSKHS